MSNQDLSSPTLTRRDALKLGGTALAIGLIAPDTFGATRPAKNVIVAGGGIAGLCCAYELMQRGHDVTVLEASNRTGGHIMTSPPGEFANGLYADLGAEQCTEPGYVLYRDYVQQLGLTLLPYRRRDQVLTYVDKKPYTEEMLADRHVSARLFRLGAWRNSGRTSCNRTDESTLSAPMPTTPAAWKPPPVPRIAWPGKSMKHEARRFSLFP